jgi:recombination protein RecR
MYSPSIQKLIDIFSKFPTVGPRTAARFVFYLLRLPKEETIKIIEAINNLRESVKTCLFCFNPFEGEETLCPVCRDPRKDKTLLCIVEKESDLASIEKTRKYSGLYFILGGTVAKRNKFLARPAPHTGGASERKNPAVRAQENKEQLRTQELIERIKNPSNFGLPETSFQEIIITVNPTTEGEATTFYLERTLRQFGKKITRLGRGLPLGGELEYADEETLSSALESRR